jgi:uncharacterized protein YjeT (DUF2065 family)
MRLTRLSLYYLATYLIITGLLWLVSPAQTMRLMLATGTYDDVFPRVAGLLLLGIGVLVVQIIRLKAEIIYGTTLLVRSIFLIGFLGFYLTTRDPLFLVVLGVVGLGVALTGTSYVLDRRRTP